jgi:hypothetical protein
VYPPVVGGDIGKSGLEVGSSYLGSGVLLASALVASILLASVFIGSGFTGAEEYLLDFELSIMSSKPPASSESLAWVSENRGEKKEIKLEDIR